MLSRRTVESSIVAGMPLHTHHRCAVYNYCSHGNYVMERKQTEKNRALSIKMVGWWPISLQWMQISDRLQWDLNRDTRKNSWAIRAGSTLEDKEEEVRRCLQFLCRSRSKKLPLRIKMWFVPIIIQSIVDLDTLAQFTKLCSSRKQRWSIQHVGKMTYGVIHLHQKGIMDVAGTLLSEETLCWIYCTFKHRKSPPPVSFNWHKSWKGSS